LSSLAFGWLRARLALFLGLALAAGPVWLACGGKPEPPERALMLALAHFGPRQGGGAPKPLPARIEFLFPSGEGWDMRHLDDPESNVFHKAMTYEGTSGEPRILTAGGTKAAIKLWAPGAAGLEATTLWEKDFGGKFSRMRDVEVADLMGDGRPAMAVATHDQGVVAVIHPDGAQGFEVEEIDHQADTFVHEIEIGDLDGDGILEVYATVSEPNRLDGTPQPGKVVRYVPAKGEGRVVVADLGMRHAKEIYVGDVDGDGRDELYVSIEGTTDPDTNELVEGVEIRRYDAGTDPEAGAVIAEIDDRLCRFLTVGDVEGDGELEMVAAAFKSGLWLLRPGEDPHAPWQKQSIDRESGGFEHASLLTDLDGDGRDELYVASDDDDEVRRYVWNGQRLARETIWKRTDGRKVFTWNIMPVPGELVPLD
jgi:hypothetical protein